MSSKLRTLLCPFISSYSSLLSYCWVTFALSSVVAHAAPSAPVAERLAGTNIEKVSLSNNSDLTSAFMRYRSYFRTEKKEKINNEQWKSWRSVRRTRSFVHHRVVFGSGGQINRKLNGQDFCRSLDLSAALIWARSTFHFLLRRKYRACSALRGTVGELCTFAPALRRPDKKGKRAKEKQFFRRRTIDRVGREKIMWKMSKREANWQSSA